jgi:hypothetical protein
MGSFFSASSSRRAVAGGALALLASLLAHGGCHSTITESPPLCTATPPTQDDYCSALTRYDERCDHCSDCTGQNLQNCTKAESAMSDAYRAAFVACSDQFPCTADPRFSTCVEQQMTGVAPTAAQAQTQTAYCSACSATNASDCNAFFSLDAGSGTYGIGYNVLLVSDALAASAVTTCSSKCDPLDYGICVALLLCAASGGDYCADGGFCAVPDGG